MSNKNISITYKQLISENDGLNIQLAEAEDTLLAIRSGDWHALIVSSARGEQIIALKQSELRYRRLFEATQDGVLILPDAPLKVTQKRADFIYNYVRQFYLQFEEHSLEPITLSMGVGVSPRDEYDCTKNFEGC